MPKLPGTLLCLLFFFCFCLTEVQAQDSSKLDRLIASPDKLFGALDKKSRSIEEKLNRQTDKYLARLQRQEHKLKKKLSKKDSLLAEQSFGDIDKKYEELRNLSGSVSSVPFIPAILIYFPLR